MKLSKHARKSGNEDTTRSTEALFSLTLDTCRCKCVQSIYCCLRSKATVKTDTTFFKHREENQLAATEWFIALIICSTCFGHLYAHRQELETILVLLPHMVCNALVAGGRQSGAGQQAMCPGYEGDCASRTISLIPNA